MHSIIMKEFYDRINAAIKRQKEDKAAESGNNH